MLHCSFLQSHICFPHLSNANQDRKLIASYMTSCHDNISWMEIITKLNHLSCIPQNPEFLFIFLLKVLVNWPCLHQTWFFLSSRPSTSVRGVCLSVRNCDTPLKQDKYNPPTYYFRNNVLKFQGFFYWIFSVWPSVSRLNGDVCIFFTRKYLHTFSTTVGYSQSLYLGQFTSNIEQFQGAWINTGNAWQIASSLSFHNL